MNNKIYYQLIGEGPPLIFIHGILGSWRNFYTCGRAMQKDYSCLLYDQRGHGRSFHKAPYTLEQLMSDLKDLIDSLKWKSVSLVGHSLGGYVSYLFANQYPEYVRQMIVVDASPWPKEEQRKAIEGILHLLPPSFPDYLQAREFFKDSVDKGLFSKVVADFLISSVEKKQKGSVKFLFDIPGLLSLLSDLKARKRDYTSSLVQNLKVPTFILRGENSLHFSHEDFKKTLQLNSLLEGREVKDSGHWIHSDQPQLFLQILKDFLK